MNLLNRQTKYFVWFHASAGLLFAVQTEIVHLWFIHRIRQFTSIVDPFWFHNFPSLNPKITALLAACGNKKRLTSIFEQVPGKHY